MATKKKQRPTSDGPRDVDEALAVLRAKGSRKNVEGMARFGIASRDEVLGVSVADVRALAKRMARDHALADALWAARIYEARMLAVFVDDPARVSVAQMNRWAKDFDNWAICDTCCFHLFDRTPHAFGRVRAWGKRDEEFVKRAAYALLASLALHRRELPDAAFMECLPLVEEGAHDPRNFVKKGVSWALRGVGHRSPPLHAAAMRVAERLASSTEKSATSGARWVGKDALRELSRKPPRTAQSSARRG